VADKEALRKSNVELQDLLSESREALQALQEEAGERLASSQEAGLCQTHRTPLPPPASKLSPTGRILSPLCPPRARDVPKSATSSTAPGPLSPVSAIFSSHDDSPIFKHPVSTEVSSHQSFVGTV
jgi:hypothetical protein